MGRADTERICGHQRQAGAAKGEKGDRCQEEVDNVPISAV